MNTKVYYLLGLIIGLFSACSEPIEVDVQSPVINTFAINGASEDIRVSVGEEVKLQYSVSDDQALSEIKFYIHNGFDGHVHPNARLSEDAPVPFTLNEVVKVEGSADENVYTFVLPENTAAGPYHIKMDLIDKEGNEAQFVELLMEVYSSSQPTLEINTPVAGETLELEIGDSFPIQGTAGDVEGIWEIHIDLLKKHNNHASGRVAHEGAVLTNDIVECQGLHTYLIDHTFTIMAKTEDGAAVELGEYELQIKVWDNDMQLEDWDGDGNVKVIYRDLLIK
ncbi:DUF4625 domain-containing protein [Algivirga pacifica]|uniref:DUF4625 domain-containing protein n=1 Tax=Algivirga pacifica TaxID=1162670 RepID=A0ABP9DFQ2_9BACT